MKKLLLCICLISLTNLSYGQSFFEIKTLGTVYSVETIESALQSANFCGYYYESERRILHFDDGAEIELKSSNEINAGNSCVAQKTPENDFSEWKISGSGHVLRSLSYNPAK